MDVKSIIKELKKHQNSKNLSGMKKFGIVPNNGLGLSMPVVRDFAKKIGTNHQLALELWETEIHEIRILACLIDDPSKVTKSQMNKWASEFYSWDICDQVCMNLFRKTKFANDKAFEWSKKKKEYLKRAGFVLMATLAVHSKELTNKDFEKYYPLIISESTDERNFVKKAVNWALRQIGKRNLELNKSALKTAEEILLIDSKSAKWIARDAIRELTSPKLNLRNK